MSKYDDILDEMVTRMNNNFHIFKDSLKENLASYIHGIVMHLEMLDEKHFQPENGVEPLTLDGCASIVGADELSINPIVMEPDAILQNFSMRQNCYLTGKIAFVRRGSRSTLFTIKPYQIDSSQEITLIAKSNCDIESTKNIQINIKLDNRKRISVVNVSNIKLSDFPNARKEFLAHITSHISLNHAEDVFEKSNNLAFEYAKAAITNLK